MLVILSIFSLFSSSGDSVISTTRVATSSAMLPAVIGLITHTLINTIIVRTVGVFIAGRHLTKCSTVRSAPLCTTAFSTVMHYRGVYNTKYIDHNAALLCNVAVLFVAACNTVLHHGAAL